MTRIALVAALLVATVAVLSSPPAHAQAQCGLGKVCFGSKSTSVHMSGKVELDQPLYPTDTTLGLVIDGGLTVVGAEKHLGIITMSVIDAGTLCVQGGCLTRILPFTTAAIDFASTTTTCNDSGGTTVTGAQVNDGCFVGVPSTGGSANASYTCYVSASATVKIRHCAAGTADDPASTTFTGYVISQQ